MLEVQHLGITMILFAHRPSLAQNNAFKKLEFKLDQTHEVAFGLRKLRLVTN
jgi:hypothetical protein